MLNSKRFKQNSLTLSKLDLLSILIVLKVQPLIIYVPTPYVLANFMDKLYEKLRTQLIPYLKTLIELVVLLLLNFCLLLLPLWWPVVVLCFVVRCFVSVLVLQSS